MDQTPDVEKVKQAYGMELVHSSGQKIKFEDAINNGENGGKTIVVFIR